MWTKRGTRGLAPTTARPPIVTAPSPMTHRTSCLSTQLSLASAVPMRLPHPLSLTLHLLTLPHLTTPGGTPRLAASSPTLCAQVTLIPGPTSFGPLFVLSSFIRPSRPQVMSSVAHGAHAIQVKLFSLISVRSCQVSGLV